VSDELAPHGPPLTDNEDKVGKKGRRRGVGNDPLYEEATPPP